jgi:hypothetical protein
MQRELMYHRACTHMYHAYHAGVALYTANVDHDSYTYCKAKVGPVNEIPKGSPVRARAGVMRFARGALLCVDAIGAFQRGDFASGAVSSALSAEAMCEGAAILGLPAGEVGS